MDYDDDDHDDIEDLVDFADIKDLVDNDIVTMKKKNEKMGVYFNDTEEFRRTEEMMDQEDERHMDDILELVSYRDEDFEANFDIIDGGDDGEDVFHEDRLDHNQQFSNENEESDPLLDEFVSDSSDLTNSHYNQVSMMMAIDYLQVKQAN